jgi:HAD superfamily hydrolase (TIGR01509 family)
VSFDLIIFDCDGVLVDSELLSCRCLSDALAQLGIDADVDAILDRFLGQSLDAILGHYRGLGWNFPVHFADDLALLTREAFSRSLRPIADIETVLHTLQTRYCVASSSDRSRVAHALTLTGLDHLFGDRLYTAQMVTRGKPAPDLFLHAASSMGASPAHVLVVEDSVSGVAAGKAAGMTVCGFIGGSHYAGRDGKPALLSAGADVVFDRIADFPALLARDVVDR